MVGFIISNIILVDQQEQETRTSWEPEGRWVGGGREERQASAVETGGGGTGHRTQDTGQADRRTL